MAACGRTTKLYELAANGTGEQLMAALNWSMDQPIDMVRMEGRKRKYNPYGLLDQIGQTLLHVASVHGNDSSVKALLELGASPSERTPLEGEYFELNCWRHRELDRGWETSLHLAALTDNRAVVELLIDAGADVNARSANGSTPLITAAERFTYRRLRAMFESREGNGC